MRRLESWRTQVRNGRTLGVRCTYGEAGIQITGPQTASRYGWCEPTLRNSHPSIGLHESHADAYCLQWPHASFVVECRYRDEGPVGILVFIP